MYWLLSTLIIIVMIAALAIADSSIVPVNSLLSLTSSADELWLIAFSILLIFISQRHRLATSLLPVQHSHHIKTPAVRGFLWGLIRRLALGILALCLLVGSALQALSQYQQAETTKITAAMRVQALVTIEGISDSVYDTASASGYRQVATIEYITPMVANLSAADLQSITLEQLIENSLSNLDDIADINHEELNPLHKTDNQNITANPQHRILLSAYPKTGKKKEDLAAVNSLQPGDKVVMTLRLSPLDTSEQAMSNPTGFDSYRWLRGRHIDGMGTIMGVGATVDDSAAMAPSPSYIQALRIFIDKGRWQLRQHFYHDWSAQTLPQQQASAVTLSLLTGDRSLINSDTKALYQLAGISHLLAISGTHVLFLAIMLAGVSVLIFNRFTPALYRYLPRWQVRWVVMISAAFIYALFTGFDVPAARTAWMLLVIGMVRLSLLPLSTMRVLLALAVLMAWADPYVLWQAGYWLSFIAVALILKYDDERYGENQNNSATDTPAMQQRTTQNLKQKRALWQTKGGVLVKRLFKLQCWLFIALLPITLLLFGKASLWGLLINLFAIGLFGWVIVPLNLLAGLFYLFLPSIADSLWTLVGAIVATLHELIAWLTALPALQGAWLYTPMNTAIVCMAFLLLLPWLLPRGLLNRWLAVPPLALLMMTVYAHQQTLSVTPSLYILPTGDDYLSVAVLHYPSSNAVNSEGSSRDINWLFLADHRPSTERTMPSALSAERLSALIEQQLRTLSINKLEGVVVQTSSPLLAQAVLQFTQKLPTNHYWQAGRPLVQDTPLTATQSIISAQDCIQGKKWHSNQDELTLQVLTGWRDIDDASVWDCSVALDSKQPLRVLHYNAAEPMQPLVLDGQRLASTINIADASNEKAIKGMTVSTQNTPSRLILDAATHQRVWQLWALLCANNAALSDNAVQQTKWLGHSTSRVSSSLLLSQKVDEVVTYDKKSLDAALTVMDSPYINNISNNNADTDSSTDP